MPWKRASGPFGLFGSMTSESKEVPLKVRLACWIWSCRSPVGPCLPAWLCTLNPKLPDMPTIDGFGEMAPAATTKLAPPVTLFDRSVTDRHSQVVVPEKNPPVAETIML